MKIRVNGVTLNVREAGTASDAPTLLFLHYFGGSSRAWLPIMDYLAPDFRCIAPDLRGFGASDAPATGYKVSDGADDIAALIAALGLNHYVLVGHSMGGKIALALAARRPSGLEALILLAPSPPTPEPIEDAERERLLSSHAQRDAAEETVRKITARPLSAPDFAQAVEDNIQSSWSAWEAWLRHGSCEDISKHMAQISLPSLVVVGASDPVIPLNLLQHEVLARLSCASLAILPKTGHLSPLEAPAAIAKLIDKTLSTAQAVHTPVAPP